MTMLTVQELSDFEISIADEFNSGKIKYPVHLENGNEASLIEIFKNVNPEDWIFVSWRGHLKALLKGVTPEVLRAAIHRGESMALRFDEHRVYGSAIVGGILPIALGAALAIKRRGGRETVWCFLGDMTSGTGIFTECLRYADNFNLPVHFIIEDNGLSVLSPTIEAWGGDMNLPDSTRIEYYQYQSCWPHCGAGKRVMF